MTILKKLLLLVVSISLLSASEVNRRLIAFYDKNEGESESQNMIHNHLENILNYYGYHCEYYDLLAPPKNYLDYGGAVIWLGGDMVENPVKVMEWLSTVKKEGKKIIWIGSIPARDKTTDYSRQTNEIAKKEFGFYTGDAYTPHKHLIEIKKHSDIIGFEKKLNGYTMDGYTQIIIDKGDKAKRALLELSIKNVENSISNPVFVAEWGFYGDEGKVFYIGNEESQKRWIANPYEIVKQTFDTSYPIPDVTTVDGKRAAFIHVDGDGALSKSEVSTGHSTLRVGYEKIFSKYPYKTGVSFIAGELDKRYFGTDEAKGWAQKILSLPHIEAASHTYTHPLEWATGKVAYTTDKNASKVKYGTLTVWQNSDKSVDDKFEIEDSVKFIDSLLPKNKKTVSLFWSGDCLPTQKDIKFVEKMGLSAINGGDTRFDGEFNSLAFVRPIGRSIDAQKQIYTAMSNENIYTELWTDKFWGFRGVLESFLNTEKPKRIKPLNLYYHHYSFEKKASFESIVKIYGYIKSKEGELSFLYPSEYYKKAKNFYNVKIEKTEKNGYKISGATDLKEFRMDGKITLKNTKNVKSAHYDEKQNVTYITLDTEPDGYFEVTGLR